MTLTDAAGKCAFCGQLHSYRCPTVRAIEYHPDGSIKRVEFMTPGDCYPTATWSAGVTPIGPATFTNGVSS